MKISKKILAVVLTVLMVFSLVPLSAFAATEWNIQDFEITQLQQGDSITSDVEYIDGFYGYEVRLLANGYQEQGSVRNYDTVGSEMGFRFGEIDQRFLPYGSDKWYVIAVDHDAQTIILSGDADATAATTYTATWKNYNGTVLRTDTNLEEGTTPTYFGKMPAKPSTATHFYAFSGWTPAVAPIAADATYTATFTEMAKSSTVDGCETFVTKSSTSERTFSGDHFNITNSVIVLDTGCMANANSKTTVSSINGEKITKLVLTRASGIAPVVYVNGTAVSGTQSGDVFTFDNLNATSVQIGTDGSWTKTAELVAYYKEAGTGVAEVNGTGYETLEEAIAAAQTGDTVTLLQDVDFTVYPAFTRHTLDLTGVTLDLDGHTITGYNHSVVYVGDNFTIKNGNMVCVYDSVNNKKESYAAVIYPQVGNWQTDVVTDKSTGVVLENLVLTGGINCFGADVTVRGENTNVTGNYYYALWADVLATLTVEDGTFTSAASSTNGIIGACSDAGKEAYVYISGGDYTVPAGKNLVLQSTMASSQQLVEISGGTYNVVVPAKACAEGFTPVTTPDAQGKYTVVEDTSVAEIAGTKYDTLAAAIAAAKAGDTVKLLKNIELSETLAIAADKNIKLDLNGNDIFGAVNGNLIENYGTVEFVTGTGHIYNTDITEQSHDAVRNFGTLTVSAPVHFGDADDDMTNANTINRGGAIRNAGGTLVINDGYYTAIDNTKDANNKMTIYAYALINDNGGTMTVNDATVYGKNNGNIANNNGNVVINGGTLSLTKNVNTNYYNIYGGVGKAEINGGTFSTNTNYAFYTGASSTIDISGGDFTYNALKKASTTDDNLNISGGTFSAVVPEKYCAPGFEPVTAPNAQGKYEVEVKTPNNGVSLTIGEDITSNYYVDYQAYKGAYEIEYTYNSISENERQELETKSVYLDNIPASMLEGGRVKITVSQAPAQMAELTEIKILNEASDVLDTLHYSSKTYCDNIIAMDDDALAEYAGTAEKAAQLKTLCNTIIAYGYAAQGVFTDYETTAITTKDFSTAVKNQIDAAWCDSRPSATNAGQIRFTSVSFACTKDARLRFYMDTSAATYTPEAPAEETGHNTAIKYIVKDGVKQYFIEVSGIDAVDFDKPMVVNYGGSSISCSVLDFCGLAFTHGDTHVQNLARTLIVYNQNAEAYFG